MDVFNYDPAAVLSLILTIMRVSIVMFMLPIFSTNNIPIPVKAAVTLVFSLGVWPHLAVDGASIPTAGTRFAGTWAARRRCGGASTVWTGNTGGLCSTSRA